MARYRPYIGAKIKLTRKNEVVLRAGSESRAARTVPGTVQRSGRLWQALLPDGSLLCERDYRNAAANELYDYSLGKTVRRDDE